MNLARSIALALLALGCADLGTTTDLGAAPEDAGAEVVEIGEDVAPPDVPDIAGPDVEDVEDVPDVPEPPDVPDVPEDAEVPDVNDDAEDTPEVDDTPDVSDPPNPCDDGSPCTEDLLVDGECVNTYVYGICCTATPMCDDGDPCTLDRCNFPGGDYGFCEHTPSCCVSDAECPTADAVCAVNTCVEGLCVQSSTGEEGCCATTLFLAGFDDGTVGGLAINNAWEEVGWHLSEDTQANSPPGSLWYGNEATGNYDVGFANGGTADLPATTLPAGVETTLAFYLYLAIEPGLTYDKLEVQLIDLSTNDTIVLWNKQKGPLYGTWFPVSIDLTAYAGREVVIRFWFDTFDEEANEGQGVFLDSISLTSTCSPRQCSLSSECDDGLGSTLDFCALEPGESAGTCAYEPNPAYCTANQQCDDGVPCTSNLCAGNECYYPEQSNCCFEDSDCADTSPCTIDDCVGAQPSSGGYCNYIFIPDCCLGDASCEDNDPCTTDTCPAPGQQCVNAPVAGCCEGHADCDDGEACTDDLCLGGQCSHPDLCCADDFGCDDGSPCTSETCDDGKCSYVFEGGQACCVDTLLIATFTGGGWDGFGQQGDTTPLDDVSWYAVPDHGKSVGGALHYGDLGAGTYDTGTAHAGSVASSVIPLPIASVVRLELWLYLDNEYANGVGNIEWDRLRLLVTEPGQPGNPSEVAWDSADGAPAWWAEEDGEPVGPKWTKIAVDLLPWRGRSVRLVWSFDTIDSEANAFEGVYLDDITVFATCQ